jgi:hypothetical protein
MIHFVKNCFPEAAVIVMGVSDRSERDEEGFKPMKVAENLSEWQRKAAMECNAAFWHTYNSMQQRGGMKSFVANGWAGKDYTHINYAGGREIATGLYHGLLYSLQQYMLTVRQRMIPAEPVLDKELEILPPELNLTDELPAELIPTEQTQPTQTEE